MSETPIMQSQDPVTKAWLRRHELGERAAWGLFLENHWSPDSKWLPSLLAARLEGGRRT